MDEDEEDSEEEAQDTRAEAAQRLMDAAGDFPVAEMTEPDDYENWRRSRTKYEEGE